MPLFLKLSDKIKREEMSFKQTNITLTSKYPNKDTFKKKTRDHLPGKHG